MPQSARRTRDCPSLQGFSVLIAEDEYFIADELAKAVRTLGGRIVGPACSVPDALQRLRAEDVTVGIVDINLRGELAFGLVDEMMRRDIPVVFATGYTTETIPVQYRDLPRWVKPYLPMTLAYALKPLC